MIAALDDKRGIGKEGKLPWHISEDLRRFKSLTTGHTIIMGRKTFESIGRALPNRYNIVITSNRDFKVEGVEICPSLRDALEKAKQQEKEEIFIIGGGQIFKEAMEKDLTDRLYLTLVKGDFTCDTFFPDYSRFGKIISEKSGAEGSYRFKFIDLER